MDYMDVSVLYNLVVDYGTTDIVAGLAQALQDVADNFSDDGLKEKAIEAANMASALRNIIECQINNQKI